MGKLRVGERLSLADGSFATVTSINFELSPRTTGRWNPPSTGSGQAGEECIGTFGTKADPQTGLFPVYNLIVADWHTYFAAGKGQSVLVHNGGPCGTYEGVRNGIAGTDQAAHHLVQYAAVEHLPIPNHYKAAPATALKGRFGQRGTKHWAASQTQTATPLGGTLGAELEVGRQALVAAGRPKGQAFAEMMRARMWYLRRGFGKDTPTLIPRNRKGASCPNAE